MRKPILAFVAALGGLFIAVSCVSAATIPAGTTLVVRTIDGISSSDQAGKRFAGKLDYALVPTGARTLPLTTRLVDTGMAKSLTTTTLSKGVYAFAFGQKGLMAGLGLQGFKITPITPD